MDSKIVRYRRSIDFLYEVFTRKVLGSIHLVCLDLAQ